ncbi:hypothetical protein [Roseovarius sp. MMSF_3350]|uniref:hypothetical protein n=1 Tax=Roseovarius sp. MMSF_3350 TaxID=3046706 RepID=UPI0027401928|nr:hypothetical protein [Roseovarius sp. MMSF_3350]
MRRFLMIFALCLTASCAPKTEIEYITPDVPAELRTPVPVPKRKAETLADVGVILTDHVEALGKANGKIVAIDCILLDAENAEPKDGCPL